MQETEYRCLACKKDLLYAAKLNKHLQICDKYTEWLKNYKPIYFKCKKCLKTYLSEEFLENHVCK
jgi:DNA-directed RNA polymerase subunit RPC12/RpoP